MSVPNSEQFSIEGKRAIVTGASSGIGRAIAESFAAGGADVVVCSREQENVDPVADGINESDRPGEALAIECDVTDREAVDALVEATVEEFGGVDILVNNAGASFMANFEGISENGWKTIVDINLHGTYHCTQAAGEVMREGDHQTMRDILVVRGLPESEQSPDDGEYWEVVEQSSYPDDVGYEPDSGPAAECELGEYGDE